MLACAGIIGTSVFHLPGDMHDVGVVAAHDAAVKTGAMNQILLWTGIFEIISAKSINQMFEGSRAAPCHSSSLPFSSQSLPGTTKPTWPRPHKTLGMSSAICCQLSALANWLPGAEC